MERLLRQSALNREKYDSHGSYLERTITIACGQQRDVLKDKRAEPGPGAIAPASAPSMILVEGNTFLGPTEQAELFKGCVYVIDLNQVLVPGGHLRKPEQFNAQFGGYTFAMDTRNERTSRKAFEAFTESQVLRAPKVSGTCFRPDLPFGSMVADAGRTRVNTYWPVEVPRQRGDVTPFLTHLAKLLPDEGDRRVGLAYLAACVQRQGHKFPWAIVLQGVEGNGKTLLSRCVAEAIGRRYVHWPKASKLAKDFNKWMVGRTFYAVEDIYTSQRVDVIEELKPMITGGDGLEIEGKGVDQVSEEICGNFIFNTNHKNGLRKTRSDRRFCVLYCAQQEFDDLARDGMGSEYMRRIYDWLKHEGGYAVVAEFLWTYEIPADLDPTKGCTRAPRTSSTDAAIEHGRSDVELAVLEAIEQGLPGFKGGWVSHMAVDRLIEAKRLRGRDASPRTREALLRGLGGYFKHPGLGDKGQVAQPTKPDGGRPRLYVQPGHPSLVLQSNAEIGRAYEAAQARAE